MRCATATCLRRSPTNGCGNDKELPFPARAEDLKPGEYWYRLKKTHGGSYVKNAYDLDAVRYDSKERVWTRYNPGVDPKANWRETKPSDWVVYGKRVYAIADGEVSGCWRNFPYFPKDLRTPGEDVKISLLRWAGAPESYFTESYIKSKSMPGAGNHVWVEQSDGSRTLYGHFQQGTVPAAVCPFSETLPPPGEGQTEIPEGSRPKVKRGQHLGRVGTTGNSGNPHLHIQMVEKDAEILIPFHGVSVKGINNNSDAPADWTRLEGDVLPPGPIAILPSDSEVP